MPKKTSRRFVLALVAAALLGWPGLARAVPPPTPPWQARPATYGVAVEKDVEIVMSDGMKLYADVYRPADAEGAPVPGRFPTLLTQTPYNKNGGLAAASTYLVERGYVDVVVDVRGTGSSGGTFTTLGTREQLDGKELVEWAAVQPWSTGSVGLHGGSYLGINQLMTAVQQPKGLKAIFPVVPSIDTFRSLGGGYQTPVQGVSYVLIPGLGMIPPSYVGTDPGQYVKTVTSRVGGNVTSTGTLAGDQVNEDMEYDSAALRSTSAYWRIDRLTVPTFWVGGWYDALSGRDAPLGHQLLRQRKVPSKLLMGPWFHSEAGAGLPADGVPNLDELQLRWFDRYVAGRPDPGLDRWQPVTYYELGDGHYKTSDTWPPRGVSYRQLYLNGPSSPGAPGTLSTTAPPADQAPDSLRLHPLAGACSRSGSIGTFNLAPTGPCAEDNRVNDNIGLNYDLPAGTRLAGPLSARLFVSTDGGDPRLSLLVEDVAPDGSSRFLTAGWDTLSFRALDDARSQIVNGLYVRPFHQSTPETQLPVEPGEIYEWWIEIFPISAIVAPGHTLRFSVQPSDSMRFQPRAGHVGDHVGHTVQIHHDAAHPSALVVPVLSG